MFLRQLRAAVSASPDPEPAITKPRSRKARRLQSRCALEGEEEPEPLDPRLEPLDPWQRVGETSPPGLHAGTNILTALLAPP